MLNNYKVDILVNNKPVTTYHHEGDTYIEGRPGSDYSIQVVNKSHNKIKVVVSVDGLSVIDGKPAGQDSPGYIIFGYRNQIISGWRTDQNTVNKFVFGDKRKSYTSKTGNDTNNIGVIGVMVFEEMPTYNSLLFPKYREIIWDTTCEPLYHTYNSTIPVGAITASAGSSVSNSAALGATRSFSAVNNLGTGYGSEQHSPSTKVDFTAQNTPAATILVFYDDRRGLEARGIVVDRRKLKPDAFPSSNGYCKRI